MAHVELEDSKGVKHQIIKRVFYSQLKDGAYFFGFPVGRLLIEQSQMKLPPYQFNKVLKAEVICDDRYNLVSLLAPALPLNVLYCIPDFRGTRTALP